MYIYLPDWFAQIGWLNDAQDPQQHLHENHLLGLILQKPHVHLRMNLKRLKIIKPFHHFLIILLWKDKTWYFEW